MDDKQTPDVPHDAMAHVEETVVDVWDDRHVALPCSKHNAVVWDRYIAVCNNPPADIGELEVMLVVVLLLM